MDGVEVVGVLVVVVVVVVGVEARVLAVCVTGGEGKAGVSVISGEVVVVVGGGGG